MRTITQAIELLENITETTDPANPYTARILVLDDRSFARREVVDALERAHFRPISASSSEAALKLAAENLFELIFASELHSHLCESPPNQGVPIVFLARGDEFERCVQAMVRGGNDLIAKPFLYAELEVKTLTLVMRRRIADNARVGR